MTMWPMRATVGRSPMHVCKRRRASMLDRRHFLIGAGALLTASFVTKAKAFSRDTGKPLVLPAAKASEQTLYIYNEQDWDESAYAKWRVTLGEDNPIPPTTPTWREHLLSLGCRVAN